MKDEEYYEELKSLKNLKPSSLNLYKNSLRQYTKLNKLSLHELLIEAENEEENRIRMRNRQIKKRLIQFQNHLITNNYQPNSIRSYMSNIKSFYRLYEIELPEISNVTVPQNETIKDIPTIEHIRIAANTDRVKQKAIILLMASSGMGSTELRQLTVKSFIEATEDYHNEKEIGSVLKALKTHDDIIPTWLLRREKTNYQYYTFSTPESTAALIEYIETLPNLSNDTLLFPYSENGIVKLFNRINDRHGFGRKETRRFFHAHSLRMFFATTLTKARLDNLIIEWMLGHSIPATKAAYYKSDPEFLKEEYMKVVQALSIKEVVIRDRTSKEIKQIVLENKDLKEAFETQKQDNEEFKRFVMERMNLKK